MKREMSDQQLILTVGRPSELPDGEAVAQKLGAIINLLRALDKREWQVGTERYRWVISKASVGSPADLTLEPIKISVDYRDYNPIAELVDGLEKIQSGARDWPGRLTGDDAKVIRTLAGKKSDNTDVPFSLRIPGRDAAKDRVFTASPSNLRKGVHAIVRNPSPVPEYVAIEGALAEIESWKDKNTFRLVERGTGVQYTCRFKLKDYETLGKHLRHRLFVEGFMYNQRSGRPKIEVQAFHLIPKDPIDLHDVHQAGLRVPNGQSASEYVKWLRGQAE